MKISSNIPMNTQANNTKANLDTTSKATTKASEDKSVDAAAVNIKEEVTVRTPKNPEYTSKIDYASESSNFSKETILSLAGSLVNSQANISQESTSKLLD